jgi:hypothetical protein
MVEGDADKGGMRGVIGMIDMRRLRKMRGMRRMKGREGSSVPLLLRWKQPASRPRP